MKKSVFTLLAIATAVFTMSSCSKDDAGSNAVKTSVVPQTNNPTPEKKDVYVAQFAISESLAKYGTFILTISDGTDSTKVDLAKEGQKVSIQGSDEHHNPVTMSYYKYTFVKKSSNKLSFKTTYTPNDAAKQMKEGDSFTAGYGYCSELTTDGKSSKVLTPLVCEVEGSKTLIAGKVIALNLSEN